MSSRHFNLESNEIHLSSTPLRGATVAGSVLGKLNIPLLLDPRFFVSPWDDWHWELDDIVKQVFFPLCNCTFGTWKGFPVGFKPTRQVSSSASLHGRSRTSGGCATWHSHRGSASIYFAMGNWKIVLKDNLSWSGQHGSITPLLFLIPETWTCLFSRGHMGCSKPIAGYLPREPWSCFLTPQSNFALPLIQICGSGCGNCTHRGFLRVVMSHMTLTSSLTRTLKIANRSSSRPKVKGHHNGMTRITWTHSLYLSLY